MTDDDTRAWVKALFGPTPPRVEPSTDDPMRQFTDELFQRAQEDE